MCYSRSSSRCRATITRIISRSGSAEESRSDDNLHAFDKTPAVGPDYCDIPLPAISDSVKGHERNCDKIWNATGSVSGKIHDGDVITKQACYEARISTHEDRDELVQRLVQRALKSGDWQLDTKNEGSRTSLELS